MAKTNFLSNKELLLEIHKSKNSYSYYVEPSYGNYNAIVVSKEDVTKEILDESREQIANNLIAAEKQKQKAAGLKNYQIKVDPIEINQIPIDSLIIRIMEDDHVPMVENKEKGKISKMKTNFKAYKHYKIEYNGDVYDTNIDMSKVSLKEVGRSHWKNGLDNGEFTLTGGNITDKLASMYYLLVERYSQKANWRNYSYLDEMKSQAILQLIQAGLKFDERLSQNPFAYYTTIMKNSFTGVFHTEKKNQTIRDDILIMRGHDPSNTRMLDHELSEKK